MSGLYAAYWALTTVPLPGVSIGLLATVAGIMSIRSEMKFLEKLCWSGILVSLLIAEVHSIHSDRAKSDKQTAEDRRTQDLEFGKVLQAQKTSFDATAASLNTAINGIHSTLEAASPP